MKIRKELRQEDITVIVDTREQHALLLDPMKTERGTLTTGDYTVKGLERKICIERKSIPDLTQSLGKERERFDKEMHRILAYPHRVLLIEGYLANIIEHRYISRIEPSAVLSSLMGYMSHQIPVFFCGSRDQMSDLVRRFVYISVQRIWRQHHDLISSLLTVAEEPIIPS